MSNITFAEAIYTALPYFIQLEAQEYLNADLASFQHEKRTNYRTYDFIVVGAGTAGCILANRLSEQHTVLLLEAGGPPPFAVNVPAFAKYVLQSKDIEYFYKSSPQHNSVNQNIIFARGKMLGGTHSHNEMIYNRGNRGYDEWAELTNDASWNYKHLLRYFKKSERYTGIFPSDQHGTKGPVRVETLDPAVLPTWLAAGEELGYKIVDANGPQSVGFAPIDETIYRGRRQTTYTSYVEPILSSRKTLKVIKYANVIKILTTFGGAYGVKYKRHGSIFKAFARKEVILSAGVYATPMLLFKSGIGPSRMLRKAGISSIADLPAGKYLNDHLGIVVKDFKLNPDSKFISPTLTSMNFEKYLQYQKEDVLSFIGDNAQGFIASNIAQNIGEGNWPDTYIDYLTEVGTTDIYGIVVQATRPRFNRSHLGSITLNHTAYKLGIEDDTELAIIDLRIWDNPTVFPIILNGIHLALNITNTKSFEAVGSELKPDPECIKQQTFKTDLYWNCVFRISFDDLAHATGTCPMGTRNDLVSVVDSELRVHGIQNLRIADASVMPRPPNSNPNAAVMVIAEKAADMILKSHILPRNHDGRKHADTIKLKRVPLNYV